MDDLGGTPPYFWNIHLKFLLVIFQQWTPSKICIFIFVFCFFWLQALLILMLSVFGGQASARNGPSFHRIVRGIEAPRRVGGPTFTNSKGRRSCGWSLAGKFAQKKKRWYPSGKKSRGKLESSRFFREGNASKYHGPWFQLVCSFYCS